MLPGHERSGQRLPPALSLLYAAYFLACAVAVTVGKPGMALVAGAATVVVAVTDGCWLPPLWSVVVGVTDACSGLLPLWSVVLGVVDA